MTEPVWIHEALAAHARRAIQTLEALMEHPPREDDLSRRLLDHIGELMVEKRELYARLRRKDEQIAALTLQLAEHTNGPAATEPCVHPERKERTCEGG